MPLPNRDLRITYGSTVLGGTSSAYYLDAPLRFSATPDTATVEATVIVVGTSESGFRASCVALETAFETPRNFLEVKFGSAVHETFDATIYTGMNQTPSISKLGGTDDTGRSRRYRIAVQVDLPADLYANIDGSLTGARRTSTINLYTTDSGRRRATITGTYTASATDVRKARAQYNAKITQYVTDITTSFGGTWEVIFDPQIVTDDQDTVCNFSIVLEELIFNQSLGTLDDTRLRRQRMTIARSSDLAGDSLVGGIQVQRLQRTAIDYSVAVDKAVTQDLVSVWEGTIKPYLTTLARQVTSSSGGIIESEIPSFDYVENRISARVVYVSVPSGTLISARITTDESFATGISLIPVWGADRLRKRKFNGPGTITRTITIVTTEVGPPSGRGTIDAGGAFDSGPSPNAPPGAAAISDDVPVVGGVSIRGLQLSGGVPESETSPDGGELRRIFLGAAHSSTPKRIGQISSATGAVLDVVERVIVARYEYYVDAGSSDGS